MTLECDDLADLGVVTEFNGYHVLGFGRILVVSHGLFSTNNPWINRIITRICLYCPD